MVPLKLAMTVVLLIWAAASAEAAWSVVHRQHRCTSSGSPQIGGIPLDACQRHCAACAAGATGTPFQSTCSGGRTCHGGGGRRWRVRALACRLLLAAGLREHAVEREGGAMPTDASPSPNDRCPMTILPVDRRLRGPCVLVLHVVRR